MSDYRPRKASYGSGFRRKLDPRYIYAKVNSELAKVLAPLLIRKSKLRGNTFEIWDRELPYFLHRYNLTWRNERAIEVSAALAFLSKRAPDRTLEFGNVLSYYGVTRSRVVVDLYEVEETVTNVDIFDYKDQLFDTIVSISTVEHVGWDEIATHENGSPRAIEHLLSLLAPGGRMFISAPLGVNPSLDEAIQESRFTTTREAVFLKSDQGWHEAQGFEIRPYASLGPGAASVWFAEFQREL